MSSRGNRRGRGNFHPNHNQGRKPPDRQHSDQHQRHNNEHSNPYDYAANSSGQTQHNHRGGRQQDQRENYQQRGRYRSEPSLFQNQTMPNNPYHNQERDFLTPHTSQFQASSHSLSFTIHTSQMNVSPNLTSDNFPQVNRPPHTSGNRGNNSFNTGVSNKSHLKIYDKSRGSSGPFVPRNPNFQPPRQVSPILQINPNNQARNIFQNRQAAPSPSRPNFQKQTFQGRHMSPINNFRSNEGKQKQNSRMVSPLQNFIPNQRTNLQNSQNTPLYVSSRPNENNLQHNLFQKTNTSNEKLGNSSLNLSKKVVGKAVKKITLDNSKNASIDSSKNISISSNASGENPVKVKRRHKKPNKAYVTAGQINMPKTGTRKSRKQQSKQFFSKKKLPESSVLPSLFSFNRASAVPSSTDRFSDDQDSEDQDSDADTAVASICSSHKSSESASTSEQDSSEDESEVMSEFSVSSSIKSSDVRSYKSQDSYNSKTEKFVSTYWDIENCGVPTKKSAFDIVKKIRETFYEGRTESDFVIVCDVSNTLSSPIILREFSEANTTIVHCSNISKNAADAKIKSFLQDFQLKYRLQNAAVVLVTGDSDFSEILCDMRYKHGIHINLICKKISRKTLQSAAHKCIFYEDFVEELPDRDKAEEKDHFLILTNLPSDMEPQKIKKFLMEKIIGMNGRVKSVSSNEAQLLFTNAGALERAKLCLRGLSIGDNQIKISHKVKNCEKKNTIKNKVTSKLEKEKYQVHDEALKLEKDINYVDEEIKAKKKAKKTLLPAPEESVCKGATLFVFVNDNSRNIEHWKEVFSKSWGNSDFQLEWNGNSAGGCLIVNFKSLSKAQKAKKIIQKIQLKDPMAPKFIKIIKEDTGIDIHLNTNENFEEKEIGMKQVEEFAKIINLKKERYLKIHELARSEIKSSKVPDIAGAKEAVNEKLNELNSQKVTFLQYVDNAIKAINCIDKTSDNFETHLDNIMRDYSRECNCFSAALPIYAKKTFILKKVKAHQVIILRAETGSGKSTQLTQYLFREPGICDTGFIICTQPRKIAAVSLAKHVSTQIACGLGDIVGYQVGQTAKKTPKTRILYMTDFTMLKMIVNDRCINEVSCIIIDEAHERTIYTDLLLGMIKSCLKQRPDLKVIITSATIDTSIFQDYYSLKEDSVLNISGRTFPIEDVWLDTDMELGWNYFDKIIETAYGILEYEEPGDILAFLTTPIETEKAVEVFSNMIETKIKDNRKILVYSMHGKLDLQEQQKIFERTPKETRKVVFSTNCAETSVTIPGIRYVIDCGMAKESQFDVKRNMNVLSIGFVSRSSAEQRRGRAGRTQVGKCYRLYSKNNYDRMTEATDPEILRVNLGQALLKLMEMGVQDPIQFDFVKSPPQESLNRAMKQLIYLEAVHVVDLSLTELGRKMAYLPIEPRLSYLVFQGIDNNVGYEGVILAALVTVSRSIFFRNSENKVEADKKKMRFCQSESDFITYFEVYKEWLKVPKEARSKWCVINCINARSMRVAHDLINELILTLSKEVGLNLSQKYNLNESVSNILLEIVFKAFSQNLCIFSGHYRLGYRSCEVAGELLIHPSSSLYTFGKWRPQYLVYDTLLQTDQSYMINVSHVDESIVGEAYECGRLEVDLEALNNLALVPLCIGPLGETIIIRDIIGKKGEKMKNLQKRLKNAISNDSVILDCSVEKGEIKIFSLESNHETLTQIISVPIREAMQKFLKEEREIYNITDCIGLTGVIVAGAEIKDIVLPGEYRDVKIFLKNDSTQISEVLQKLMKYGNLILPARVYKNHYRVTFSSPVCAKKAVDAFKNEAIFSLQGMSNDKQYDQPPFYKVLISTARRPCSGEAFLTVDPASSMPEILLVLLTRPVYYNHYPLKISLSKKTSDLRIHGLPADTDRNVLMNLLKFHMPSEAKVSRLVVVRTKPFESSDADIQVFKNKLTDLFSEFTPREKITIDIKKPRSKDFTWNGIVYFKNSQDGESAVNALKGDKYLVESKLQSLVMKPVLQTCLFCRQDIFAVVKDQIEAALKFFNNGSNATDTLGIDVKPKGPQHVQIEITSNNIRDIVDARKSFLNFLQGQQIKCGGNLVLENLFSSGGISFLNELQNSCPNALIHTNVHSKVISLFGNDSTCNKINIKINSFLDHLVEENYKEIPLTSKTCQRGILKELLKKYGYDLDQLKNLCTLSSVEVNSQKQILIIKGSPSSVVQCEEILQKIEQELADQVLPESEGEECPICLVAISEKYRRLEYCGHAYCKECFLHLLQNADTFPVTCLICNSLIVVADVIWATKEVKSLESNLCRKALAAFTMASSEIKYCPTPDCNMLYRSTVDNGSIFDCPSCNNSICTKCCVLNHVGLSCEIYQCSQNDDDYPLKVWIMKDPENRKVCPSCSAPIEKNGGCTHMTCWKCKCHMCWLCLKTFPCSDDVYNHQPLCQKK